MGISHAYTQTVADGTATSVVRPSDWNSGHILVQQFGGNTAGASSISGTNIVWAGGNNVTLSANGSTVSIIGPTTVAQSVQTQASGAIAGTGTTFAGTNASATLGLNSNGLALSLSAAAGGGGGGSLNVSAGTTSNNLTNLVFSNSNGLAFGLNGSTITGSYTVPTQTAYVFSASNGIAFGTNGSTVTASYTVPTQTVQTQAAGNIAGTGYTSTTQAGTTVGLTQNTAGLSAAWPPFITTYSQSVQTQASGAIAGTGFTSTTTAGTAITAALGTNGLTMAVPQFITTYAQSTQTQASGSIAGNNFATTTVAGTAVAATMNTSGLTMAVPPFITSYAVQTTQTQNLHNVTLSGNTSGTLAQVSSGTLTLAGGNNITLSQVGNAITISGANAAAAPINFSAGTTSNNLGSVVFSNSNGISFGLNGSTITASYNPSGAAASDDHFYPFFAPGAGSVLVPVADNTIYMRELEVDAPVNAVRMVHYSSFSSLTSTFAISGLVSGTSTGSGWGSWVDNMTHYLMSKSGGPSQTGYNIYYTFSSATNSIGASMSASMSQSTNAASVTVSFTTTIGVMFPISIDTNGNVTYTTLASNGSTTFQSNAGAISTISSTFANTSIYRQLSGIRPVFSPMPGNTLGVIPAGELIYGMKHSVVSTQSGAYNLSRVPYMANSMIVYTTSASYIEIGGFNTSNFITGNIYGGGFGSITGASTASITNATGFNETIVNNLGSNASLWVAFQNYPYSLTATTL